MVAGAALARTALKTWGGVLLTLAALALVLTLVAERIPAFVYMGTGLLGVALLTTGSTRPAMGRARR